MIHSRKSMFHDFDGYYCKFCGILGHIGSYKCCDLYIYLGSVK